MAILHRPGEVVEYVLPSDRELPPEQQTVIKIKVPDEAVARKLLNLKVTGDTMLAAQIRFGAYLVAVENLKFADGGTYQIEKEPDGRLTAQALVGLQGIIREIDDCIDDATKLTGRERKNS